jgi:membrane protein
MRGLIGGLLGLLERAMSRLEPVLERVAAVGFVQAAVVLAAQAFLALFPLLIAVVALTPTEVGQSIATVARNRLGLGGHTGDEVSSLVTTRDSLRGSITVFGAIVVFGSATSFTRALQRLYENAWQLPRLGLRGSIRGLGWLVGLIAYLAVLGAAVKLTASPAIAVSLLRMVMLTACAFLLWWLTPFVLLCGRVRARALVVTGVLTAAVTVVAARISAIVMPRIIGSNERQFGTIGAAFAIESWLVVMASLIVAAAVLGALAGQSDSVVGRWTRGTSDPGGWRRTPRRRG